MTRTTSMAAAFAVAASAFAYDADTLAFYAFKEGAAETSLDGITVVNDAGAAYSGTLALGTSAADTVLYKADAPGPYVFGSATYGATVLCENPQSIYFEGGGKAGEQVLAFADLASAISSNDDYTVEFFVKLDPADKAMAVWEPFLQMECGMLYNPKPGNTAEALSEAAYANTPQTTRVLFTGAQGQNLYTYVRSATYHPILSQATAYVQYMNTGGSYFDGYWHHYAMVYTHTDHKMTHYMDYGLVVNSYTTTNSTLDVSKPVKLGNGKFKGWISCLRASKTARAKSEFLRCSQVSTCEPETVFHWRLDGENGTDVTTVSNICAVLTQSGQYVSLVSGAYDGHGTAVSWTNDGDVAVFPVYTNEVPYENRRYVMAGDRKVGENGGSVRFISKTHTTEGYGVAGTGLKLNGADHHPFNTGSFTMEAWMKFDYRTWKQKIVDAGTNPALHRLTLFGTYSLAYNFDWTLHLMYASDGYKLKLQAYDSANHCHEVIRRPKTGYLMDDKWHHFAVVYDDSDYVFTAYVDGVAVTNVAMGTAYVPRTKPAVYQVGYGLNNCAFEGLVDEVRLTRRALSPSEFLWFRGRPGTIISFK